MKSIIRKVMGKRKKPYQQHQQKIGKKINKNNSCKIKNSGKIFVQVRKYL